MEVEPSVGSYHNDLLERSCMSLPAEYFGSGHIVDIVLETAIMILYTCMLL